MKWMFITVAAAVRRLLSRVALTQGQMSKLDAFQQKRVVREIMKSRHSYEERANTNQKVLEVASAFRSSKKRADPDLLIPECFKVQRLKLLRHVLRALPDDPMRRVTLVPKCGAPLPSASNRVGTLGMSRTIMSYMPASEPERVTAHLAGMRRRRLFYRRHERVSCPASRRWAGWRGLAAGPACIWPCPEAAGLRPRSLGQQNS